MLDLVTLQLLKKRQEYQKYSNIAYSTASDISKRILMAYGSYFKMFPKDTEIKHDVFFSYFMNFCCNDVSDEEKEVLKITIDKLANAPDEQIIAAFSQRLSTRKLSNELTQAIGKFELGEDIDLGACVKQSYDNHTKVLKQFSGEGDIHIDVKQMIEDQNNNVGLHWRQPCLNGAMRALQEGDSIGVAARPDVGKTTFLCDAITYFAKQCSGRPVIYFNNEGCGKKIKFRLMQSALRATTAELYKLSNSGVVYDKYMEALGGNDIKVFDVHGKNHMQLEMIIEKYNPRVVLFDMLDKVRFAGNAGGSRTDQVLESLYDWARDSAVLYGYSSIQSTQLSSDADGQIYPALHMLKDSKTGKQGSLDALLTIGKSNDTSMSDYRYFGLPKNKLRKDGSPSEFRSGIVELDASRASYTDKSQ